MKNTNYRQLTGRGSPATTNPSSFVNVNLTAKAVPAKTDFDGARKIQIE